MGGQSFKTDTIDYAHPASVEMAADGSPKSLHASSRSPGICGSIAMTYCMTRPRASTFRRPANIFETFLLLGMEETPGSNAFFSPESPGFSSVLFRSY
jgi:hypothetical protein